MPIVVEVRPEAEFDRWLADQRQALALASQEAVAARNKQWTMAELLPLGEEVFVKHCATCHQATGLGQTGKYPALSGSPIVTGTIEGSPGPSDERQGRHRDAGVGAAVVRPAISPR